MGEVFFIRQNASQTYGQFIEIDIEVSPNKNHRPLHIHPKQTEYFKILEGSLNLQVNNEIKKLQVGDEFTILPNTHHCYWNSSNDKTVVKTILSPALNFEDFLFSITELEKKVPTNNQGVPINKLIAAQFVNRFKNVMQPSDIPKIIVRLVFPLLSFISYIVGNRLPKFALMLIGMFMFFLTSSAQTNYQIVKGQLIDDVSKSPIRGAIVTIISTSPEKNIVTDSAGFFKFNIVPTGRQTIKFSHINYEEQIIPNVLVTAGKEVELIVTATEKIKALNAVVVSSRKRDKGSAYNDLVTVSGRSFNTDDTKKFAGSLGDPSRMAANFAGVVGSNDSRNDIVVRGNSPSGMLWQLEGINIPNPNHFGTLNSTGGPVSMLNSNNIGKSDFLTSAFPSQYGNAVGGVFDLKLRNGNRDKNEFLAQMSFNGFEAGAEGPFSKKSKASYLVNYRYSSLGAFKALGINTGTGSTVPVYQDINFKIFIPIGDKSKLTLFGLGGTSKADFYGKDVDTTKTDFYGDENQNSFSDFKSGVAGISYEHQFNNKTSAKLSFGISGTSQKYNEDSIGITDRKNYASREVLYKTTKYSLVFNASHKFNAKNSLVAGFTGDLLDFNLFNKDIYKGTIDKVWVDIKDKYLVAQAYVDFKHRFSSKLSLNTGVHFQSISVNNSLAFEPRVGLRFSPNKIHSFTLGYGLHSQAQNVYTYFIQSKTSTGVSYSNKDLDFTKSHHLVLGYNWNINSNLRFKTEIYYQSLFDVPVEQQSSSYSVLNSGTSFGSDDKENLVNKGKGTNYGVELTLERFYNKGLYFLLTTSIFQSKYKGSDNIERNTAFNNQYVVNGLAGKEFKIGNKGKTLSFNLKITGSGGKFLTPIDFAASKIAGKEVYIESQAYTQRQSSYFRSDIKIAYRKDYKKSSLEIALDLQNVTNQKNIYQQSYNPRNNSIGTQYQQGFLPVPMIKYTF